MHIMNPSFRLTILFGVLLCALHLGARPTYSEDRTAPFHALKPTQIRSFSIIHRTDTATLTQKSGQWLTAKEGLPADPKRFEKLLKFINSLTVKRPAQVMKQAKSQHLFGLVDSSLISLAWQDRKGKRTQVRIGFLLEPEIPTIDPEMEKFVHHPAYQHYFESLPIDPDSTYWQPDSDTNIYITPGNPGFLASNESVWQDRSIFPYFTYENVLQVDVKWRDSTNQSIEYKIRRIDDTSAQFVYPKKMPIPRRKAGEIYIRTPQFAVDDYVDSNDLNLKFADFENPTFSISIHFNHGKKLQLKTGRNLDGFYYAIHPKYKRPVKIVEWRIKPFMRTVEELQLPPSPQDSADSEEEEDYPVQPDHGHEHEHSH